MFSWALDANQQTLTTFPISHISFPVTFLCFPVTPFFPYPPPPSFPFFPAFPCLSPTLLSFSLPSPLLLPFPPNLTDNPFLSLSVYQTVLAASSFLLLGLSMATPLKSLFIISLSFLFSPFSLPLPQSPPSPFLCLWLPFPSVSPCLSLSDSLNYPFPFPRQFPASLHSFFSLSLHFSLSSLPNLQVITFSFTFPSLMSGLPEFTLTPFPCLTRSLCLNLSYISLICLFLIWSSSLLSLSSAYSWLSFDLSTFLSSAFSWFS